MTETTPSAPAVDATGQPWRTRYGPLQLCDALGLTPGQRDRARQQGIIPAPDAPNGKWLGTTVRRLAAARVGIVRSVGAVPDVGAAKAAEYLAARLGIEVDPDALPELARRGRILVVDAVDKYHGSFPVYCGRALENWPTGPDAVAEVQAANVDGELLTADRVADRLNITRTGLAHLVRLGWLEPVDWARGPHTPRSRPHDVPLYRMGDVTDLLRSDAIDWNAVWATPKGKRSPLAALPDRTTKKGT